jgi:CBS domain-containing protein
MNQSDRYAVPKIKDIMTKKVIFFSPEMELEEVLKSFNKYRISSGPVLENNSKDVIGFISEDDLMREMASISFFHGPSAPVKVKDVMTQKSESLNSDLDVFEAEKILREKRLRHAPVTDKEGHLVGILARRDILRALEQIIASLADHTKNLKEPKVYSIINEAKWRIRH